MGKMWCKYKRMCICEYKQMGCKIYVNCLYSNKYVCIFHILPSEVICMYLVTKIMNFELLHFTANTALRRYEATTLPN